MIRIFVKQWAWIALACAVAAACTVALLTERSSAAGPARRTTAAQRSLLARYEPFTQLDPRERFLPHTVNPFLAAAELQRKTPTGHWRIVRRHAARGALPGPGSGTWRLDQADCTSAAELGGLACEASAWKKAGRPAVYGRAVHQYGKTVLQYWYFYPDDVYSYRYPASNFIWQAHRGDWEVVNVVLSRAGRPLFVSYSQHCGGRRRTWARTPRVHGTHPVVHVAAGSHANYFSAGTHPIDTRCIPARARTMLESHAIAPPVDYAFKGPTLVLSIHVLGGDRVAWVRFPGFWGGGQYIHGPAPVGTVAVGASPLGPAFHPVWRDPLGTLARWH